MAANDAFTAGVRPGGLTDSTEIRLLLCYLVKNAGPITRTEIENALMEEALVNYFEIGSCLDDITQQKLVTLSDGRYSITEKGRKVAQELAFDLPRSVRERAVAAVLRSQTWARKEAQYAARITEKPDGHCSIRCTIRALDQELFCLDIGTPDRLSADLVKKAIHPQRQRDLPDAHHQADGGEPNNPSDKNAAVPERKNRTAAFFHFQSWAATSSSTLPAMQRALSGNEKAVFQFLAPGGPHRPP